MKIIDATDTIMGRLASFAAKELLNGEQVVIINAEKSIITGSKNVVFEKYAHRRERRSIINPLRFGPKYPRRPDGILRRAVRGMLPWKKATGKAVFKNLRVYIGRPVEFKQEGKALLLPEANLKKLKVPRYVTLEDLSRYLGASFEA
ncbi:MAG TPA: 50S ribosomal protein L13 [Euryarchaeota archaeon]|nr:50S ribosomal protein L13 [archaeon BMS3Abin16]GBE57082.1 50S ribosomal protein L13 [archaeon BMS3Bbin16]HDH28286.1 50S ribosomal protein L13 [Euryarchaeota archaeon]HDY74167.1 50S ribosomal protein L13 [Euryarchaeota archaeon]